jgi:ABC-type thiamine transport system substrate-binding protein
LHGDGDTEIVTDAARDCARALAADMKSFALGEDAQDAHPAPKMLMPENEHLRESLDFF